MLFTDLRKGQQVEIGEAKVTVVSTRGARVRLSIDAPRRVEIKHERRKNQDATVTQDA